MQLSYKVVFILLKLFIYKSMSDILIPKYIELYTYF